MEPQLAPQRSIISLNHINKTFFDKKELLNKYLSGIKEESPKIYNDLIKNIDDIENHIPESEFKPIIQNVMKAFLIMQEKINSRTDFVNELLDMQFDSQNIITNLEADVKKKHQDLLTQNNIPIPKYEHIDLSLHTTVKSDEGISKRVQILRQSHENQGKIKEWLDNVATISKKNVLSLPSQILKDDSKETGINIKVIKNERNKVIT